MNSTTIDFADRLKQKRGRDARGQSLATRFTKAEEEALAKAAEADGKTLREWTRDILLRETRRSKDDALFTEVIAVRMFLNNLLGPIAAGQKVTETNYVEIMENVRLGKRNAAREVMQQYTEAEQKEQ